MAKICKNNILRLFIGGLLRIVKEGELKAMMQQLHGWSDKEYGEYLNIFIGKWNDIPDDTLTENSTAWIARDKNGGLWLYNRKPVKDKYQWVNCTGGFSAIDEEIEAFSEVRWKDAEPRELILK